MCPSFSFNILSKNTLVKYNKALLEYHEMTVATETKRKQSAFGDETLQEYAQRIIESNKKITESIAEAYEKRLADHVQYINDEKALQERYINQMENNDAFIKMAENQKQSILQVMDTIDWSKFSFGEGSQFTQELSKMGDKIVETTEKMGAQAQAINDLENAYASNKAGLIEYTKGLGEQYEIAKKLTNKIVYKNMKGTHTYIVNSIKEIDETDFSILKNTEDERLTLITCVADKKEKKHLNLTLQML